MQVGYLDHGVPLLADLDSRDAVVVPLLLSSGFHVHTDIPTAAPRALITTAVGPDPVLAAVLADRLRGAGWTDEQPVVLAAAGSADPRSIADAQTAAEQLGAVIGVNVPAAFVAAGDPALANTSAAAVASYVLSPGHFADEMAACGAAVVSAPIGADPRVAEVIVERYDARLTLQ